MSRVSRVAKAMQAAERGELESEMHMRFGVHLFGEGDYDGAMAHFGMCSAATPVLLLKLFPSLAPTALMEPIAPCFPGAPSAFLRLLMSCHSQNVASGPPCLDPSYEQCWHASAAWSHVLPSRAQHSKAGEQ